MVTPGLYRHSKTGNLYRVLFEAEWFDRGSPAPMVGIHAIYGDRPEFHAWQFPHTAAHQPFLVVNWSGNTPSVGWHERLVVYVGLYGEGRISARTREEFTQNVTIDGATVPRFVRVGD